MYFFIFKEECIHKWLICYDEAIYEILLSMYLQVKLLDLE
jgi:hypothetical protein